MTKNTLRAGLMAAVAMAICGIVPAKAQDDHMMHRHMMHRMMRHEMHHDMMRHRMMHHHMMHHHDM